MSWVRVYNRTPIREIAAGEFQSFLLTETRELFACGGNEIGELGLRHYKNQASWIKLNPFSNNQSQSFDEILHQRHSTFTSVSLKTLLKQCDALFQQLHAEEDKAKQLVLFSEMKSSLQEQLPGPLPAPWDHEFAQMSFAQFNYFYHRLREHFESVPVMEWPSISKCQVM
jgi:alpha-tubulin suppressor-like RCC1 family protein